MRLAKFFIILCFLLTFAPNVSAQKSNEPCSARMNYVSRNQVDPPTILLNGAKGRAVDSDGKPVPEICVALFTEKEHRFVAQTIADENGYFKFRNVPNGSYRLVGRVSYDYLCPVNVRIQLTKKIRQKQLVLHMRASGIDTCSYGDTK